MPRGYWIPIPQRDYQLILRKHTVLRRVAQWTGFCGMGSEHDRIYSRFRNVVSSDIHGFQFNEQAKFWLQGFISDEVDRTTKEILQDELDTEIISVRGRWPIEGDENINITVRARGVARR